LLICCKGTQHVINSEGIHPKMSGESQTGKTDLVLAYLHCLDPGCYRDSGQSPLALFYHELPDQSIIFLDDYEPKPEFDTIIKKSSAKFHERLEHDTVIKQQAETLRTPAEIVWIITSVDPTIDIQVLNRQFSVDTDESKELTREITAKGWQDDKLGRAKREVTEDVLVCRCISKMMQGQRWTVKIPDNWEITWTDDSSRRNPSFFRDILKAHTAWRHMQRQKDETGALIATEQDFEDAKKLYTGRATAIRDKLSDAERRLAIAIVENKGELTRDDAAKKLGISTRRVGALAIGKYGQGGLAAKLSGFSYEDITVPEIKFGEDRKVHKKLMRLEGFDSLECFDEGVVKLTIKK